MHTHTESYTHAAFVYDCICVHSHVLHFWSLHTHTFALHSVWAAFIVSRLLVHSSCIFSPMHSCDLLHLQLLHPLRIHLHIACVQMHVHALQCIRVRCMRMHAGCAQKRCARMYIDAHGCVRMCVDAHISGCTHMHAECALMLQNVVE